MKLEMRDVAGDEDKIERAFAADLVGDVDLAALRILNVRDFHGEQCLPRSSFVQRPKKVAGTCQCASQAFVAPTLSLCSTR